MDNGKANSLTNRYNTRSTMLSSLASAVTNRVSDSGSITPALMMLGLPVPASQPVNAEQDNVAMALNVLPNSGVVSQRGNRGPSSPLRTTGVNTLCITPAGKKMLNTIIENTNQDYDERRYFAKCDNNNNIDIRNPNIQNIPRLFNKIKVQDKNQNDNSSSDSDSDSSLVEKIPRILPTDKVKHLPYHKNERPQNIEDKLAEIKLILTPVTVESSSSTTDINVEEQIDDEPQPGSSRQMLENRAKYDTSRRPQAGKMVHYTRLGPNTVKFGEHSVVNNGVTENICYLIDGPTSEMASQPNFFTKGIVLYDINRNRVLWNAGQHAYSITSQLRPPQQHTHQRPYFDVTGYYAQSIAEPVLFNTLHVRLNSAVPVGQISLEQLSAISSETLTNNRKFGSLLAPTMQLTAQQGTNLSLLAGYWNSNLPVYDNSAIYAKLMTLAFHKYRLEVEETVPAHANLNAANIVYIQIQDAANNVEPPWVRQIMDNVFGVSAMVVDWAHDYRPEQHLFYILLAMEGPHFLQTAANDLPNRAYSLPGFRIIIISKGANPGIPANNAFTAQGMYDFARTLAVRRQEFGAFERGVYMAAEISCPLAYVAIPAVPAVEARPGHAAVAAQPARYSALTAYLDATPPVWPTPQEYNWFARWLNEYPHAQPLQTVEYIAVSSLPINRLYIMVLIWNALISALSTTVLYTYNITGTALQHGLTSTLFGHYFQDLLHYSTFFIGLREPETGEIAHNSYFQTAVANLLHSCTGLRTAECFYTARTYNHPNNAVEHMGDAQQGLTLLSPNAPPRRASPLSVDAFLINRPLEWAISSDPPTMNLQPDMSSGLPDVRGFYAYKGDSSYTNVASSVEPYVLVPYSAAFVNAISQSHGSFQPPVVFTNSTALVVPQSHPAWIMNNEDYPFDNELLPNASHPDVATIMTYDWEEDIVIAPCVIEGQQEFNGLIGDLMQYKSTPVLRAGYPKLTYSLEPAKRAASFGGLAAASMRARSRLAFNLNLAPTPIQRGELDIDANVQRLQIQPNIAPGPQVPVANEPANAAVPPPAPNNAIAPAPNPGGGGGNAQDVAPIPSYFL